MNDRGWVCAENGELMLWVPEQHRNNVRDMSSGQMSLKDEKPIAIDWGKLIGGEQWSQIRSEELGHCIVGD